MIISIDEQPQKHTIQNMRNRVDHIIERVLYSTDPYTVLDIRRNANEEEIEKAYKRMCLILHPDRCKHERAEEAFKKLANVKSNLLDCKKRQHEYARSEFIRPNQPFRHFDHDIFDAFYRDFNGPFRNRYFVRHSNNIFDQIFSEYYRDQNQYYQSQSFRSRPFNTNRQTGQDENRLSFLILLFLIIFVIYFS